MTCWVSSSIEAQLKLCGQKCKDIKKFLLSQSGCEGFEKVLEHLYFTEYPPTESHYLRKCVITTQDKNIELYVLLNGDDNLLHIELLKKAPIYKEEHNTDILDILCYAYFGRVHIYYIKYNKCFCDRCLEFNLFRGFPNKRYRLHVFKDFFISLYTFSLHNYFTEPLSLVQQSIGKLLTQNLFICCKQKVSRKGEALWLGDGIDPVASICRIANQFPSLWSLNRLTEIETRFQRSLTYQWRFSRWEYHGVHIKDWDSLEPGPYLLIDIKGGRLYLHIRYGYNVLVYDYPEILEKHFRRFEGLFFFCRTIDGYTYTRFDAEDLLVLDWDCLSINAISFR